MEFRFNLNEVFKQPIVEIGHTLIPTGFKGDRRALWDALSKVTDVVNAMGAASASAQGLTKPITTAERLRNSDQQVVYLLLDPSGYNGKGAVTGLLKTGRKGLYVFDRDGHHYQVQAPCVLDFYVHESRQRHGLGKTLFEHMLSKESVKPEKLAIDRPSDKFLGFLTKHYSLQNPIRQMNNYVVYDGFFPEVKSQTVEDNNGDSAKRPANGLQAQVTSPYGRYGAPRPPCSMGQIIHNQSAAVTPQEPTGQEPIRKWASMNALPTQEGDNRQNVVSNTISAPVNAVSGQVGDGSGNTKFEQNQTKGGDLYWPFAAPAQDYVPMPRQHFKVIPTSIQDIMQPATQTPVLPQKYNVDEYGRPVQQVQSLPKHENLHYISNELNPISLQNLDKYSIASAVNKHNKNNFLIENNVPIGSAQYNHFKRPVQIESGHNVYQQHEPTQQMKSQSHYQSAPNISHQQQIPTNQPIIQTNHNVQPCVIKPHMYTYIPASPNQPITTHIVEGSNYINAQQTPIQTYSAPFVQHGGASASYSTQPLVQSHQTLPQTQNVNQPQYQMMQESQGVAQSPHHNQSPQIMHQPQDYMQQQHQLVQQQHMQPQQVMNQQFPPQIMQQQHIPQQNIQRIAQQGVHVEPQQKLSDNALQSQQVLPQQQQIVQQQPQQYLQQPEHVLQHSQQVVQQPQQLMHHQQPQNVVQQQQQPNILQQAQPQQIVHQQPQMSQQQPQQIVQLQPQVLISPESSRAMQNAQLQPIRQYQSNPIIQQSPPMMHQTAQVVHQQSQPAVQHQTQQSHPVVCQSQPMVQHPQIMETTQQQHVMQPVQQQQIPPPQEAQVSQQQTYQQPMQVYQSAPESHITQTPCITSPQQSAMYVAQSPPNTQPQIYDSNYTTQQHSYQSQNAEVQQQNAEKPQHKTAEEVSKLANKNSYDELTESERLLKRVTMEPLLPTQPFLREKVITRQHRPLSSIPVNHQSIRQIHSAKDSVTPLPTIRSDIQNVSPHTPKSHDRRGGVPRSVSSLQRNMSSAIRRFDRQMCGTETQFDTIGSRAGKVNATGVSHSPHKLEQPVTPQQQPKLDRPQTLPLNTCDDEEIKSEVQNDELDNIENEVENLEITESKEPPVVRKTPSHLTEQGYFDLKFYHNKLW